MSFILNPDGSFMSEDQIADDIVGHQLDAEARKQLLAPDFSPIDAHFGLGLWIRNSYGLWDESYPRALFDDPDEISQRVIEKVVGRLRRAVQN
jgi:hypothetical protein